MFFTYYIVFSLILLVSLTTAEFNPITHITNLEDLELTSAQATQLCKKVKATRLADQQSYLWTQVHAHEESENNQATFSPHCFTLKYQSCVGESRYPVTESCGFFIPTPDENCSSNKGSQRSSIQHLALTHNTANHLCHSVNDLPTDSPLSVNYVPIKILLVQPAVVSQAADCIHWVHRECNDEQTGCGWKMVVDPSEKCLQISKYLSNFNATHQERYPNAALRKTDFLESNKDDGTSVTANSFMSGVVKCLKKEHSVSCQVVPEEKGTRSKRSADTSKSPVTRVKRSCCNFYRCRPCGFARFLGRGPTDECDCSDSDDTLCQSDLVCDQRLAPNGKCNLCCGADCY